MTGIYLLFVAAIWLAFVVWLSKIITKKLPTTWWRMPVGMLTFAALLPLPLIDEIVGGRQFARLCEANVVHVNKDAARGKTVYKEADSHQIPVPGLWVRVRKMPFRFLDAATGEVVLSFDQLHAEGGRLFPGFDSGHDPLTFKGECHPPGVFEKSLFTDLGLTRVEKSQAK